MNVILTTFEKRLFVFCFKCNMGAILITAGLLETTINIVLASGQC